MASGNITYTQSKLASIIEASVSTMSGFIISFAFWQFVISPLFDLPVSIAENFKITALFTVLSVIRGYCWRRVFNKQLPQKWASSLTRMVAKIT